MKILEEISLNPTAIVQYARKSKPKIALRKHDNQLREVRERARPIGVFVADSVALPDGKTELRIGWSCCCNRDCFSKKVGLSLAYQRMVNNEWDNIPPKLQSQFSAFICRCEKYYRRQIV